MNFAPKNQVTLEDLKQVVNSILVAVKKGTFIDDVIDRGLEGDVGKLQYMELCPVQVLESDSVEIWEIFCGDYQYFSDDTHEFCEEADKHDGVILTSNWKSTEDFVKELQEKLK